MVVAGVTAFDVADSGELPVLLVAWTVKVYDTPFVRPLTVIGLPPLAVSAPGVLFAV